MAETPFGYISPIGPALIQPLVKLLETLMAEPVKAPNQVQTGRLENGYSAAIIVLAAMVFESAIGWIRYHEKDTGGRKHAAAYFSKVSPDTTVATAIKEVFTLRDTIAHSHLWEGQIVWDENCTPQFADSPSLQEGYGYGDDRFRSVLDPETRCSKHLKLNLLPSRIWRQDAYIVLNTIAQALKSLEAKDPAYHHFTNQIYGFQGWACTFYEIIEALPDHSQVAI